MPQIDTYARQAWQLRQQGYSIDRIADAMGHPTSSIERWLITWDNIDGSTPPWYDGLDFHTVSILSMRPVNSMRLANTPFAEPRIP
ncbi:MAG: hypothetical protein U9Q35_03135 [Pseudomonadota bacterium]|nr:hypothetical protein [Pseudomonadota bacterium]